MVAERVIYTDGHKVMVTNTSLQVEKSQFRLRGIIKHGIQRLKPNRFPGVIIMALGLAIGLMSYFNAWPHGYLHDIHASESLVIPATTVGLCLGGLLILTGVLVLGFMRELYAVRIETAEGEKNVVISSEEEYIQQILRALSRASNLTRTTHASAA